MKQNVQALFHPRFNRVRREGRGLLTPAIYRAIYDAVASADKDLDVIDIGAAGGASTVAAALALKDEASKGHVIAIEKCEGGSRHKFGSYSENQAFLEMNFSRFDVTSYVKLFPHYLTDENAHEVIKLISTKQIAGFTHDADGRIDRDFCLFGPLLTRNHYVIVDDYSPKIKFTPFSPSYPFGGTKNIVTYRILNYMMELGIYDIDKQMGTTVFGRCRPDADFTSIDRDYCEEIFHDVLREHARWSSS